MKTWLIKKLGGCTQAELNLERAKVYTSACKVIWDLNHQTEKVRCDMKALCKLAGLPQRAANAIADRVSEDAYQKIGINK